MKTTAKASLIAVAVACSLLVTLPSYAQTSGDAPKNSKRNESRHITWLSPGTLASETIDYDDDLDGEIDHRHATKFAYDEKGRLASKTTEYQNLHTREAHNDVTRFEYDDHGHLIHETLTHYGSHGDQTGQMSSVFTYENNRMATNFSDFDDDGDGKVDRREKNYFTYSEKGERIKQVIKKEKDGKVTEQVVITSTYGRPGLIQTATDVYAGDTEKFLRREVADIKYLPGGGTVTETKRFNAEGALECTDVAARNVAAAVTRRSGHSWFIVGNMIVIAVLLLVLALRTRWFPRLLVIRQKT